MGEDYWLHALPWVTFVVTFFLFVFMCWIIYYSYLGTKMQNPTKSQSITTMIFAVIFGVTILVVFGWSIFHLIRLYSKKRDEPITTTTVTQNTKYVQPMPVQASYQPIYPQVAMQNGNASVSSQVVPEKLDAIRTSDPEIGMAY